MSKYNLPNIDGFQVSYFDPDIATGNVYITDDDEREYRSSVMEKFAEFAEIRKQIEEKYRAKTSMEDKIKEQLRVLKATPGTSNEELTKQLASNYKKLKVLLEKTISIRKELQVQYASLCLIVEKRVDYLLECYRKNRVIISKING